jgi:ADP-heptose:LPS heptosyltransferase
LICGLSWVSKNDDIGFNKSITLEILKPILILQDIVFIDLQYNDTKEERSNFLNKYGVEIKKLDTIDNFNDLNGITSLINLCDIIITVSNTNAHIAGALGKETYLLLPKGKGRLWYWSTKKNKSLWYKSIIVLQQKILGKWDNPIQTLRELLRRKVNE